MRRVGLFLIASCFGCVGLNPAYSDGRDDATGGGGGTDSADPSGGTAMSGSGGSGVGTSAEETTDSDTTAEQPPDGWEFTDDEQSEFEAGDLNNLHWSGDVDAVVLELEQNSGRITSRVFTTGGPLAHLTDLEWDPAGPYGVGLFDPEVDEIVEYELGGCNIDGLELLLRFDDEGDLAPNDPVPDASVDGNDGTVRGATLIRTRGVFKNGLTNGGDGYIEHPTAPLAPGTTEFTWTAWYRNDDCGFGETIISFDAPDTADLDTESVWLACGVEGFCDMGGADGAQLQAAAFYISDSGERLGPTACSGKATIDDSIWHHVALRLRHTGGGSALQTYVDGEPTGAEGLWGNQFDYAQGPQQTFATLGNAEIAHSGAGDFDEVTVWDRPLEPNEIKDLYSRGASDVVLRVRACMQEDCSDEPPFVAPDGMDGFRDSGPPEGHGHDIEPLDLVGVAFQYELHMDARSGVPSPRIPRVSMYAVPADD